jgi:hypothetical protein
MLTNRAYLGFIKHRGEWHNGNFEPILSPTLFEAVQKVFTKRKKPRKQKSFLPFVFTGFAKCGECGCAITAQYSTNRYGVKYCYYRCTKKSGKCSQPYLQEYALSTQLQTLLQKVSLPLSEIEEMEKQVTVWESESISERGSVAQNLKTKLSDTKEKLDKLITLYLDGDIEREIYLERKDILLREKAKVSESLDDFGQQKKQWLQPLRSFVLSLKECAEIEKTSNHLEWKKFFQKIGSNPEIKDKTVSIHWGELWDFVANAKGVRGKHSASFCSKNLLHISNYENVSACARISWLSELTLYTKEIKSTISQLQVFCVQRNLSI